MLESPAPRVVVLGRTGDAQQQLQKALEAIGAQMLAAGDFDQLDPEQMLQEHPDVILVSIDETTNEADIDRWQAVFNDPATTVVFDDADVTRRLSGWDLARWARHLVAKVLGRQDVLPPVQADAERLPQAMLPEFGERDEAVPSHPAAEAVADIVSTTDSTPSDEALAPQHDGDFAVGIDDEAGQSAGSGSDATATGSTDDADFAALSAQFDAQQEQRDRADKVEVAKPLDELLADESLADSIDVPAAGPATKGAKGAKGKRSAAKSSLDLELSPLDADLTPVAQQAKVPTPDIDVGDYELEPLSKEPAGGSAVDTKAGGVIAIVAGLGGPDAVRQVLAGLSKTLPVPVLLWQHLDAGKHDRLAQQLGKASALPVYLARPGELARVSAVAVMTATVGVEHDVDGWWFKVSEGGVSAALESALAEPASMAMVLSGADGTVVSVVAAHAARGGEARVQKTDTCFDSAAAAALSVRGVAEATPADLAAQATERWPS